MSQGQFQQILGGSDTPLNFSGVAQDATGKRADALKYAKQFLGTPYVWGGTTPQGFDCSGLVQYVWKKFGVSLPRISQQQAGAGDRVALNDLKPMDLVLFNEGRDGVGHVAFWLGNGQILEAPHSGSQVRIRKLGKRENVFGVHLNVPG
jgi:cell wall-associated NlpC family hydrolase